MFTWEEKFEWMHQKKLKGNRLVNKRNYFDAVKNYREALIATNIECDLEVRNMREKYQLLGNYKDKDRDNSALFVRDC